MILAHSSQEEMYQEAKTIGCCKATITRLFLAAIEFSAYIVLYDSDSCGHVTEQALWTSCSQFKWFTTSTCHGTYTIDQKLKRVLGRTNHSTILPKITMFWKCYAMQWGNNTVIHLLNAHRLPMGNRYWGSFVRFRILSIFLSIAGPSMLLSFAHNLVCVCIFLN